jgi:adenosyl cobinamide kinase/adenosyl cobinamide phosphate guanylyltransferase
MSHIVLFTGGARSGKSLRAEQYAARLSERIVLACPQAAQRFVAAAAAWQKGAPV